MEIKRYTSINFLIIEMEKDLFGVDINNPTGELNLLSLQLINLVFNQSVKKSISINGRKLINFFLSAHNYF